MRRQDAAPAKVLGAVAVLAGQDRDIRIVVDDGDNALDRDDLAAMDLYVPDGTRRVLRAILAIEQNRGGGGDAEALGRVCGATICQNRMRCVRRPDSGRFR